MELVSIEGGEQKSQYAFADIYSFIIEIVVYYEHMKDLNESQCEAISKLDKASFFPEIFF